MRHPRWRLLKRVLRKTPDPHISRFQCRCDWKRTVAAYIRSESLGLRLVDSLLHPGEWPDIHMVLPVLPLPGVDQSTEIYSIEYYPGNPAEITFNNGSIPGKVERKEDGSYYVLGEPLLAAAREE